MIQYNSVLLQERDNRQFMLKQPGQE